jgi:hypothetical protein
MDSLGLPVTTDTPDSLSFIGFILVLRLGKQRGDDNGMVCIRKIAAISVSIAMNSAEIGKTYAPEALSAVILRSMTLGPLIPVAFWKASTVVDFLLPLP